MIKNHWGRGLCGTSHSCGHRQAQPCPEAASRPGGRSARPLCPASPLAPHRPGKAPARRALSVEDVSAPGPARPVGRLLEVFPDGTSQLQLQRPPEGTFGFNVASGNGRRDSGRPPAPVLAPRPPGRQQTAAVPSGRGRFCFRFSPSKSSRRREPLSEGTGILPSRRWRWQACPIVPPSILKSDSRLHLFRGESEGGCLCWLVLRISLMWLVWFPSSSCGVCPGTWTLPAWLCTQAPPSGRAPAGDVHMDPGSRPLAGGPARSRFSTGRIRAGLWTSSCTLASSQPC